MSKTCIPQGKQNYIVIDYGKQINNGENNTFADQKCDGIVHCYYGEDEDLKACAHIYPESATIKCLENNRGNILRVL